MVDTDLDTEDLKILINHYKQAIQNTTGKLFPTDPKEQLEMSIKAVFDSWKNTPDSKALLSNLEKNQELKSLMLEETPWVLDAKDETERKKRVALLFDMNKMSNELAIAMKKLQKANFQKTI